MVALLLLLITFEFRPFVVAEWKEFEEDVLLDEAGVIVAFVDDDEEHVEVTNDLDSFLPGPFVYPSLLKIIVGVSIELVSHGWIRLAKPGDILSFTLN